MDFKNPKNLPLTEFRHSAGLWWARHRNNPHPPHSPGLISWLNFCLQKGAAVKLFSNEIQPLGAGFTAEEWLKNGHEVKHYTFNSPVLGEVTATENTNTGELYLWAERNRRVYRCRREGKDKIVCYHCTDAPHDKPTFRIPHGTFEKHVVSVFQNEGCKA